MYVFCASKIHSISFPLLLFLFVTWNEAERETTRSAKRKFHPTSRNSALFTLFALSQS